MLIRNKLIVIMRCVGKMMGTQAIKIMRKLLMVNTSVEVPWRIVKTWAGRTVVKLLIVRLMVTLRCGGRIVGARQVRSDSLCLTLVTLIVVVAA